MKNKLLLFLLVCTFFGNILNAKFSSNIFNSKKYISDNVVGLVSLDTVKKKGITAKTNAIIPPPLTTAGSACKDASLPANATVDVFVNASGGSGDLIEWFDSQTSTTILYTGSIYRAKVAKTTTFYVQTHSGPDFSIRVPVVASVYTNPSPVVLTANPSTIPLCEGTSVTFTASGGADLFEFSVNGVVVQPMSTSRTYTTSTLTNGQTVKVRSRYDVSYDGLITEAAWGTGNMEDNMLSASLSSSAIDGYMNSIKISSTEDKLVFGISGKLGTGRSMLLFLDTKPGGFNVSNFGDDTSSSVVNGFNYFNNNPTTPSTFDSYFFADYCLAISPNVSSSGYFADLIELKTGSSTKINLGNTAVNSLPSLFGVDATNAGVSDYDKGFEIGVLKTLLGYSVGDIKFFGFTVRDDNEANFSVTNSFLSPERTNGSDYGNVPVDYNFATPNPVVVSSDALVPCYSEDSMVMNIVALPTISGTTSVCIGSTTTLTGSGSPNATNPWVSASPSVATVNSSGVVTGVSAGTSVITYTNSNGCSISQTVTVNPLPTITGNPIVCAGLTTTLTGSATPNATNPWVSASPSVATVNSSGVVTGVSAGTSVITYTNSNGCSTTETVTVNALPTITGTPNVCVGLTTTLTGSGTPNATNPWVSASPSVATISNSGVVTGVSVGTSLITYTNSEGCSITQTFTVNPLPTITGTLTVCVGLTTTLSGSGTPSTTNPWVSANPSVATINNSGVVTGVSAGTSVITYTNSNGCTVNRTVTVNALPTITGTPSECIGFTSVLTGSGTPSSTNPWVSATPSVATVNNSGVVTGVSGGTSVITYTNSNGCSVNQIFTVYATPTISGSSTVCIGLTTSLTGSGTPSATNPWTSASPSVATVNNSGVVTGVSAGTSIIRYTDNNGCTITQTVTVNPLPTITGNPIVCAGLTTTLTGSATPNATNPWVSASPSVATVNSSGVVTGVSAGTSVITYTNSNGCSITQTVTVNPLPTITGTPNVCVGLTTTLTGSGTPNATNPWVSASPSVANITNSGVVTGVSVGTSIITYTNSDGCSTTQTFTVNPLPTITGNAIICVGLTTTLTGSGTPNPTNPWVSANPSVATINNSGVVTGVSAGTSVITYTNSNGCTVNRTVTVNALPTITGTPSVCIGFTSALIGSGTPSSTNPWVSATPSVATVNNSGVVTGVSGGTSVITYTNSNGCSVNQIFTVYATPTISGNSTVCIGLTTSLTGSGTPNATNPWTSASPSVATVSSSGVVTGVSAGTSIIRYTDNNGCTITQTVTVNPLPTITGNPIVCAGLTTTLTGSATPNATNPWVSASPSVATVNGSGVVTGVSAGTSVITYTNSNGCSTTQTVTVNALPTITGTPNVCIGLTTALTGSGTPNATNPWVSASPSVATVNNSGVVTGVSVGTSLITYTNSSGCKITQTVTVNALPIATLSSNDSDNTFCSGTSVAFTASGGVNYNFRVNNSSVQNGASAVYTTSTLTNGQFVDVIVTNASGCTSISTAITNTVLPLPVQPILSVDAQPSCIASTGSFKITNYNASYSYTISPSTGVVRIVDMVTAPSGIYVVTATSGACSSSATITVNPVPPQIQFESTGDCIDKDYVLTASPFNNSYDASTVNYEWKDNLGNIVGTNSNVLNATDVVNSMSGAVNYPLTFTLKVSSDLTKCSTVNNVTIESVFCNIQKGISPDGNGSNDFFDLKFMDVSYLQIFDRYGIRVYDQHNYKDQWKGQSNKGEELPSATYYYVIDFNNGKSRTGWIYLIR
ncbi:Ig-like domain-containing protein [Flavobacterium sp. NG2]|uniref:Ig-like domain-containing protein n=1 Tax=Flavobacterium sp. NG2 TaxID=3097547 RepID=UPI002A7F0A77|nr:Ig-like domain-containing protein [Flavobacterium sp. NG2]WPR72634.1 Ig-like domain-containing protein [Flavobacterium sp. NG2]